MGKKEATTAVLLAMFLVASATSAFNIIPARTALSPTIPANMEPPAMEWSNNYGWGKNEYAFCVQLTSDGGYIVVGSTSSGSRGVDGLIFKTDSNGVWKWGMAYGGNGYDYFYSVKQTRDGGFICAGASDSKGGGNIDIWLLKTNATGEMQWEATFGDKGKDTASSVAQTSDGGYIIAGSTGDLLSAFKYDMCLIKTNTNGTMEWSKTFGAEEIDFADSVSQTRDGGYIVAGTTNSFGSTDAWLIKTDSHGELEIGQIFGGPNSLDQFYSVRQTGDNGYIMSGYTNSSGVSDDFWLVKVNATFSLKWSRTFGGLDDDYAYSLDITSDGGYVLAGSTYSSGDTSPDYLVVKTDSNGNCDWSQVYGTDETDQAQSICETKDGGFIVAGYSYDFSTDVATDAYLVKIVGDTDKDGLSDTWERRGIDYNKDGVLDFNLSAMGVDWKHKDLFVEVDYMGSNGTHDHKPDPQAIEQVKTAFKNAPVKNPDGKEGIKLHVEISDQITHQNTFKIWDDFDDIKYRYFGNKTQRDAGDSYNILHAKALIYRYCLFIHIQAWLNETSNNWDPEYYSGIAESIPANDFVVSLGDFTNEKGTADQQAGTFMHELGHTLGLMHGGGDDVNYKPNYLSIMSYAFQFPDPNPFRPLDYSRTKLPDLDEAHLNENEGVGAEFTGQMLMTVFSNRWGNASILSAAFGPIDWNQNGNSQDADVSANINNFRTEGFGNSGDEILTGFDDWAHIVYNFRDLANFADNVHGAQRMVDLTWDIVQQMHQAAESSHDVAIVNVETPSSLIVKGSDLNLNATLMNQGGSNEACTVTVYLNTTVIASKALSLGSWKIETVNLTGTTFALSDGAYTLKARLAPVTNETDTGDNTWSYGTLTIASSNAAWAEWSRTYTPLSDYEAVDVAYSVCQTADGGFALAGETGINSGDFWLVKTYPNGSKQWDKTYGTGYLCTDGAYSVQQTSEGGFILAGYAKSPQVKNYALFLVKTDSEGNPIWNKTYVKNGTYWSGNQWVVKQTTDGGYIAAGTRCWEDSTRLEHREMWLIRTDSAGKELWNKTYGTETWAIAYSVWQTDDGGYAIGGYTTVASTYGSGLLIKTDSLGNHQWNKTFPGHRIFSLQQTIDKGYILAGRKGEAYPTIPDDYGDFWLAKTDSTGNTLWNKTYTCSRIPGPLTEEAHSVQQTTDGGYILAGYAGQPVSQSYSIWIVKTDGNGNMQTDLTHRNGPSNDIAYAVIETQDGTYVAAGSTQRTQEPWANDFILMKFRTLIVTPVIPEFQAWTLTPSMIIMTLIGVVLLRKRKEL